MVLGRDMALLTSALVTTTWAYDQLGFARHPIGKNFCNIWGYMVFETAAVKLIGKPWHTVKSPSQRS